MSHRLFLVREVPALLEHHLVVHALKVSEVGVRLKVKRSHVLAAPRLLNRGYSRLRLALRVKVARRDLLCLG